MKSILKYGLLLVSILLFTPSCNDFLDTLPDNRAEIDTEDKVIKLLVSAYPNATHLMMSEYWSDNWDMYDWNLNYDNYTEELFFWKDIYNRAGNDTNFRFWELSYKSIAAANQALQSIEEMGNPQTLKGAKGEALITRAYNHFQLASLFCFAYGKNSNQDMGIPYVTEPEITVRPEYQRGTVEELYKKISDDIEAALPLIDDNIYPQPKYHFNKKAAYAFAAKFYTHYGQFDKVIEYSTKALGNNPMQVLRDWKATTTMGADNTEQPDAYINKNNPASLLVSIPVSSWSTYGTNNYPTGNKFSHSKIVADYETIQSPGPWKTYTNFYIRVWWNTSTNKFMHRKIGLYFEKTDPVSGTGYIHTSVVHFTTDETLLYRAEAYILTKQYDKAYADLNMFMTNYSRYQPSYNEILTYYQNLAYYTPTEPTAKKKLNPPLYTIQEGEQENLLQYLLHVRRILLLGEGQRWQDVKRYGITIHRRLINYGFEVVDVMDEMPPNDLRRAMQIPPEIVNAGFPENPR